MMGLWEHYTTRVSEHYKTVCTIAMRIALFMNNSNMLWIHEALASLLITYLPMIVWPGRQSCSFTAHFSLALGLQPVEHRPLNYRSSLTSPSTGSACCTITFFITQTKHLFGLFY